MGRLPVVTREQIDKDVGNLLDWGLWIMAGIRCGLALAAAIKMELVKRNRQVRPTLSRTFQRGAWKKFASNLWLTFVVAILAFCLRLVSYQKGPKTQLGLAIVGVVPDLVLRALQFAAEFCRAAGHDAHFFSEVWCRR